MEKQHQPYSVSSLSCCGADEPCRATTVVIVACTAASIIAVVRHRARRDNSRNCVLVDHLADRVFQQDHELIERLNLPLQLNTIHQINRNRNAFPDAKRSGNGSCKDWPLSHSLFSLYVCLFCTQNLTILKKNYARYRLIVHVQSWLAPTTCNTLLSACSGCSLSNQ
ncbi:Uncharacterised protein [Raoultella planticola]|uniref:Uncharacterized protein n=1 Tax=Raoultella planticola TaxID=575 RepID=A0A485APY8_RAOPL|nr:Uncharacterised protein [Raoultella planticola]